MGRADELKMLNSLASYLLGYPGSTAAAGPAEGDMPPRGPTVTAHVPSVDVRLSAVEADDDDWLLVDKTEEDEAAEGSLAPSAAVNVPSTAARLTLAVNTTSYHWPDSEEGGRGCLGAAGAAGAAGPMEESWFVTPPPCFTSGSVPLETSPLENLLIEHPSMSVYHRSTGTQVAATPLSSSVGATPPSRSPQRTNLRKLNRGSGARGARPAAAPADSAAPPRTNSPSTASSPARSPSPSPSPSQNTAVEASPRRPSAFSPYQQQQQSLQYRTAQKLVQRAACQQLKRDSLERNNKAREIRSSRNKRQRRSDHMQRHSGANNNRKC